jgi:hypothetical protein
MMIATLKQLLPALFAIALLMHGSAVFQAQNPPAQTAESIALVRHAPDISGRVEGSLQMLTGENVLLSSGSVITKDLLVPGQPRLILNGTPTFGGRVEGTGSPLPSNFTVTLASKAELGRLITRTDPVSLGSVPAPPASTGSRDVTLTSSNQSIGNPVSLRDLTLSSNIGPIAVPPGTYRKFTVSSGSSFVFGSAGRLEPSVYNLNELILSDKGRLQVLSPVVINVASRFSLASGATAGSDTNASWLLVNVAANSIPISSKAGMTGILRAPASAVIIDGTLVGLLFADRLSIPGGGLLRMVANTAPVVTAGPDLLIPFGSQASLNGTASDDGLPVGSSLTTSWSKVSGPGLVTFGNPSAAVTTASFSLPGIYLLRLTASDSQLTSFDEVTIAVNQAPMVNAGPDQTITLPANVSLNGAATDDGIPTGGVLTAAWSKVSGPGTVTFSNANAANTTASFSLAGAYALRLTASDTQLTGSDDVEVTVTPALAPTIVGTVTPPPNVGGWNNTNVTITFVCTNATSCQTPISVSTEGASQVFEGTASGAGGTVTTHVTVNLDKTPPVEAFTVSPPATIAPGDTVALAVSATDNLGLASVSLSVDGLVVDTRATGPFTFSFLVPAETQAGTNHVFAVEARDLAGNSAVLSRTVLVTNESLSQLGLLVQPPISPTFQSSQVIAGSLANAVGQTALNIAGGASAAGQRLPTGQAQFGLRVPLRPNAENLLTVTATDDSGQTASARNLSIVQLTLSSLVTAQVTAQRLSTPEVQALVANGTISLSNPSNFNVSMFAVALTIGGRQASVSVPVIREVDQPFGLGPLITISCQEPGKDIEETANGLLIPCEDDGGGGNLKHGPPEEIELIPFDLDVPGTGGSVPGVLLIEGKIKTLKEFFKVNLLLLNLSSGFTLTKVTAILDIPDQGLSPVAPASGAVAMDDLAPGTQGTGQFIIRGDEIGVHTVSVKFGALLVGPLLPNPIPISGSASTQVEVKGPPTLDVTVEHPDSVTAEVSYTLKVNIRNTSADLDALFASLELNLVSAGFIDPTTGLPTVGPTITSLGDILAGQTVSQSFSVTPHDTGPITSCVGGATANIKLSVVFSASGLDCAIGTIPSQTTAPSGRPTVAVLPAPNTTDVSVVANITAFFSAEMQTQTITTGGTGTFRLLNSVGALVPGQLQFSSLPSGATVATLKPNSPLQPNTTYTIVIGGSVFNVQGSALASGITASFTTGSDVPPDATPPQVSVRVAPPTNPLAVPQGQMLGVLIDSSDNSGTVARVDLLLDGQLVDSRVPNSLVTFLLDTSDLDPDSSHLITAVANDLAGNRKSASLNIAIISDTTAPTVTISAGTTALRGQTLPVAIQADDNIRVARVDLFVDSSSDPVYTGLVAPYRVSLNTNLFGNGSHQLRALVVDGAGNVAQSTLGFSLKSLASITLSPTTVTLHGTQDTQALTVTGTLTDASTTPVLSGVAFSSSDTNVAIVSPSGLVTSLMPGTAIVTAIFGSLPPAQATVTNIAAAPTTLTMFSGDNQTRPAGQPLAAPLIVKVTDANSRPVPNVPVTFSVLSGGGTVAQSSVRTDVQGRSSTILTLGPVPGANSVSAAAGTLAGSPVTFHASGTVPNSGPGLLPTATSELFNPSSLNWSPPNAMGTPRAGTSVTVLGDGTGFVVGGVNASTNVFSPVPSGELFNAATGVWTPTASLAAPRAFHTTTLLPNGDVLITGGMDASGNPVATSEIYHGPAVQKATPIVSWPSPTPIVFGTLLGGGQLNATANVPGTFVYNPPAGTRLSAGSHTLSVTFVPTDTIHYATASATVALTVTP